MGWHDIGGLAISAEERSKFYMEVSYSVERMKVTPLLSALYSVFHAPHYEHTKYGTPIFQQLCLQVIKKEAVGILIATYLHCCRF